MGDAKDPLDKKYYTYVTNVGYTKYQLLALMEDTSTSVAYVDTTYAGYETRAPGTKGASLGVLLQNTGTFMNTPVQEGYSNSFTGVDILNTTGSYTMQFHSKSKVSGTGVVLKAGIV